MAGAAIDLVQVSDSHLSETHAWFHMNWPVFLGEVAAAPPDLVVHTGDVSFNGPDRPADLAFGRRALDAIPAPWLALAGNHDVGEAPAVARLGQPVDDARLAAWRAAIGPSWWCRDLDKGAVRLRLVGLDSALMGSGHADEAAQWAFLDAALAGRAGRSVLLFQHLPPFVGDPDDDRPNAQSVPPAARRRLLAVCRDGGVAAIAAGHIHRHSVADWHGVAIVTAPATAFVNGGKTPEGAAAPRAGYLRWSFDGETLTPTLVEPPLFLTLDVAAWARRTGTSTTLPPRPLAGLDALAPYRPD